MSEGKKKNAYAALEQFLMQSTPEDLKNELFPQIEAITVSFEDTSSYENNRGEEIENEDVNQYIDSPDEEAALEFGEGVADEDEYVDILPVADKDSVPEFHADIIFYNENSKVKYEINLGKIEYLLSFVPTQMKTQDINLIVGGTEISYYSLCEGIRKMKYRLTLLAKFLSKAQERFLLKPNMKDALSQFRSYDQNDFIRFVYETENPEDDITQFIKSNKSWVSRIVKKKAQVPFSGELLTLNFFFDTYIERINILRKAFEIYLGFDEHTPLNATDQAYIINELLPRNKKTNPNTIKDQLWPAMRKLCREKQWQTLFLNSKSGREIKAAGQIESVLAIITKIRADYV
jgi:hypothetical protein